MSKNTDQIEKKILRLYEKGKTRPASNLVVKYIEEGFIFTNKELLKKIIEPFGYTVAHKLANKGIRFEDKEILTLKGEDRKNLNTLGHSASSVAFVLAKQGYFFEDIDIQALGSEKKSRTVAHEMAKNGYHFKNKEILKLKDDIGLSVAHEMAKKGYIFEDKEILDLENEYGFTVRNLQENNSP